MLRRELAVCPRNSIDLTEISLGVIHTLVITGATDQEKIHQKYMEEEKKIDEE